jgi:hypothetical protein
MGLDIEVILDGEIPIGRKLFEEIDKPMESNLFQRIEMKR